MQPVQIWLLLTGKNLSQKRCYFSLEVIPIKKRGQDEISRAITRHSIYVTTYLFMLMAGEMIQAGLNSTRMIFGSKKCMREKKEHSKIGLAACVPTNLMLFHRQ